MERIRLAAMRTDADASQQDLLSSYLTDHYAGACAGVALAARLVESHSGTDMEADLRWLQEQIGQDREALRSIMSRLGVHPATYKEVLAFVGERVSRLKLNGQLLRRSPVSTLIELEAMQLGVYGKRCGWQTLRTLADQRAGLDASHLDELTERAEEQTSRLEQLRKAAALRALGDK